MVSDIMHSGNEVPVILENAWVSDALLEMTEKKLGMTAVVNKENQVLGVFTDGDLRRMLEKNLDIHKTGVTEVMTANCKVIQDDILAAEAMKVMQQKKINALLIVDDQNRLSGALNMHDLIRAGIV
jgi:arabinose-5-phosphate isomerase